MKNCCCIDINNQSALEYEIQKCKTKEIKKYLIESKYDLPMHDIVKNSYCLFDDIDDIESQSQNARLLLSNQLRSKNISLFFFFL